MQFMIKMRNLYFKFVFRFLFVLSLGKGFENEVVYILKNDLSWLIVKKRFL